VLGAGSWGTSLAVHLARSGHEVRLWGRNSRLVLEMGETRRNPRYLQEIPLPLGIVPTDDAIGAMVGVRSVVIAVPSHEVRGVVRSIRDGMPADAILVSAAKGLETDSLLRMSQVIADEAPGVPVVVLSGPSFALEVARGLPTAVLAASADSAAAAHIQECFRGSSFRLYGSDDVAGVEIGGALKNVIAIAAGVVEGLGLGQNALAALITRGLAEVTRLACAAGGRRETLAGLSGLGDLVLTCTGNLSRNRHVGAELAHGRSLADILAGTKMIAEGVRTTGAALDLGARYGVELPIATQMAEVLAGRTDVRTAIGTLMLRRQRAEAETG